MNYRLAAGTLAFLSALGFNAHAQQGGLKPLDPQAASLLRTGTAAPARSATGYTSNAQLAPIATPASTGRVDVLPAGTRLSVALEQYVTSKGWQLRWNIDEDYLLDVGVPIPAPDVIQGVTWIVSTYQSQGGMLGVVPRFAKSNRVVVIEKMDVRNN